MDPTTLSTGVLDAAGRTASSLLELAVRFKAPAAVVGILVLVIVALWGLRAVRGVQLERAPEPISDGQTAEDRSRPPAREGGGEPGGGKTGGEG